MADEDGPSRLADLVAAEGVASAAVLDAIRRTPRRGFVPDAEAHRAYRDEPIPIGHGQVTTQPSLTARMIEALELNGDEGVLEVGTGHGWQTALLARLAGRVWSVERHRDLARTARRNLEAAGIGNVEVRVGDGTLGWPEAAPYDAILVSAAFPEVPPPLKRRLAPDGRLVQPIGPGGAEDVILFVREGERLEPRRRLTGAFFVRLVGRHGFQD